jgi:glycosyltransferase A (GT-A) superfamily protein (DUF2064 family)
VIGAGFVLVMAKTPVPGRVKTRLCPPCTPEEAAAVAAAALADTLDAVAACHASRRVVALDGLPGPWLPAGFEVIAQRGDGLAQRLAHAWSDARADNPAQSGIQIGMDTPHVDPAELDGLLSVVAPGRAVLGAAVDGGWWVIGLAGADPMAVFDGIPMSTPVTGAHQQRRLRALGLAVHRAPVRRDIDTAADLVAVAAGAPGTRTAALAAALDLDVRASGVA